MKERTLLGYTTGHQTVEGSNDWNTICFEKFSEVSARFHEGVERFGILEKGLN